MTLLDKPTMTNEEIAEWEAQCRAGTLFGDGYEYPNSAKTHCPQGHPYDEANTYVDSVGSRVCRACRKAANRAYSYRRKQQLARMSA